MKIDRTLNGADLTGNELFVAESDDAAFVTRKRPRIGVDYAGHWAKRLLRFYIDGNKFVSKK
jgi:DNA-3-methyladenine glycosylase